MPEPLATAWPEVPESLFAPEARVLRPRGPREGRCLVAQGRFCFFFWGGEVFHLSDQKRFPCFPIFPLLSLPLLLEIDTQKS